ncbi:MAG: hypothetical protein ACREAF_00285 [Nitrosopumilaceae archaeon]
MSEEATIPWFDDFIGVGYRYYDLRMNVFPLFQEKKQANKVWEDVIKWWPDPSIKIRFVEVDDDYWFVMGGGSPFPESNKAFFKFLKKSEHYERFKVGHDGEAYLRFGIYKQKGKFFYVELLKKKKIVTDIKFLQENEIKDDALAWNCLYNNKYKNKVE